ncbi:MAG: Tim44/TimA family putative adaptor protein [Acetobacteraceae bacterium]
MGAGGFPIDLVLFGMIAAFLLLRLRSILGRRDGFEPSASPVRPEARPVGPVIEAVAETPAPAGRPLPDPTTPLGQTLAQMRRVDRNFDAQRFLAGAEGAFRLIVTEFAAGNRDALRPLLAPETFATFEASIAARETAGERQTSEIRAIPGATIIAAALHGALAEITVQFVSDQISQTLDSNGHYVSGTDAVTELRDDWTFTRDLSQPDPTWRLAQARPA